MKIIIGLLLFIFVPPMAILGLAYDSHDSITYIDSSVDVNYMSFIDEEKDRIREDIEENFNLFLNEESFDQIITGILREQVNQNYRLNANESAYLMNEPITDSVAVSIRSIQADFNDDILSLNLLGGLDLGFFDYKARLSVDLLVEDDGDTLITTLDRIRLGRIPIPGALLSMITSRIDFDTDLPVGVFNKDDLSFSLSRSEDYSDDDSIVAVLWYYINAYDIAFFTYENEGLSLQLNTAQIRVESDAMPDYLETMESRYGQDYEGFDGVAIMSDFIGNLNVTDPTALTNGVPVTFSEAFINEYIEVELKRGDYNLTVGHEEILIEHFFLEFMDDKMGVNLFMSYDGFYTNIELLMDEDDIDFYETRYLFDTLTVGRSDDYPDKDYLLIEEPLSGFIDSQTFEFGRIEDGERFYLNAAFFNQFIETDVLGLGLELEFQSFSVSDNGLNALLVIKNG